MAKYYTTDTELKSIADAIREKGGTSASLEYPSGFVSAIGAIQTGGGGGSNKDVIFLDYDGSVVATKTKAEISAMTSDSDLPANPTHTGLTAQGWNWTVAQLKAQLTAMPDQTVYVGQMYVTTSGATEIDVEMHEGRLSPILTICVKGTVSVDWGDGTTADTVTGTSLTTRKAPSHTYSSAGNYTITVTETSGSEYAFDGSSSYTILRKNTSQSENSPYTNGVKIIRLGSGIKKISNNAFCYCRTLINITIPSNVTSIGTYVFNNCNSLTSITIPSSVTSIGNNAFQSCYSLANITIPSGVTSIGINTFENCTSLASITIPSGVTSIGNSTFYCCYSLTSVTILGNVTSIGNYAFASCSSLTGITISSSVTSIGTSAFSNCSSLASVTIPSDVTSIGNYAFQSCSSLANITIPSSVTSIGNYAFQNCSSLTSVTISSSVTSIGTSAFSNCSSLASVTIPSDVTSIGNSAFYNCCGVSEYHVKPTTPPTLGTTVFSIIASDCVIYVPRGKLSTYQTATGWSAYASKMQEEPT